MEIKLNINGLIAEGKSSIAKLRESKTYNKNVYDSLLNKYAKAIETIELLNGELERLKNEELTPEKVQVLGGAMSLLGQLTPDKIKNLEALQGKFGNKL